MWCIFDALKLSYMNLIEELRWRGMLQDTMPGTEEQLQKEMTTAYIGFDPTASSLHIGNLATIMLFSSLLAIALGFLVYRRLTRGERSEESTVEGFAAQI